MTVVAHLLAAIIALSFLATSAIVPGKNECWTDRIFAFSGHLQECNATKRCVNETILLEEATRECGQRPKHHTLRENCGHGHFFAIDYTCCSVYRFHEHCLLEPQWNQSHTDTIMTAMKNYARSAKTMLEARKKSDHATASLINKQLRSMASDQIDFSGWLTHKYYDPSEGITFCTNKSDLHVVPEDDSFVSRHRTYFEFRKAIQNGIFVLRYEFTPGTVRKLALSGFDCKLIEFYDELANPKAMMDFVYSNTGGCYFFPDLEEPKAKLTHELFHNTSIGFDPPGKDFWDDKNATNKYCQWLVHKLTDPEFTQEETAILHWVLLLLSGAAFVLAILGFVVWKRRTYKVTNTLMISPLSIVNHVYNDGS
uniref:Uncharacterized protein n=1 Tax=Steinernema glaseri TaxID=37863 RepID=A0A1I8AHX1_9BILA